MYDLKGKLKRCNICGEDVMGEELLKEHFNKYHEDDKPLQYRFSCSMEKIKQPIKGNL